MHIFFDTEFTQFREGELLSIGFVSDEDHELVVEVHDPGRHRRASEFCQAVVIPQFGSLPAIKVGSDREAGCVVAEWLSQFQEPLTLAYDFKLDWAFLEQVLVASGHWSRIRAAVVPFNVADVANYDGCLAAQENYFAGHTIPGRHHPLIDARALRARWRTYLELEAG
ncbi:MAG: hypothetical protein H6932_02730 [Burkholderiaceae bacterium]|nr:hypothetical protein [Burkholderiaceae bacterium]